MAILDKVLVLLAFLSLIQCGETARRMGLKGAGPHTMPTFTDGLAFMSRGMEGISVLTFEDGVTMPNYHQMGDTSANMDFDMGWGAVEFCWELLAGTGELIGRR